MVVRAQGFGEVADGFLHQRQFVGGIHRAGGVDEEDKVGGRAFIGVEVGRLYADADELAVRLPRRGNGFGVHGEGFAVRRQRVVVGEVVGDFFDTHGVGRRQTVFFFYHAAHVAVTAGIDVDAEGRDGIVGGALHGVYVLVRVFFGVFGGGDDRTANAETSDGIIGGGFGLWGGCHSSHSASRGAFHRHLRCDAIGEVALIRWRGGVQVVAEAGGMDAAAGSKQGQGQQGDFHVGSLGGCGKRRGFAAPAGRVDASYHHRTDCRLLDIGKYLRNRNGVALPAGMVGRALLKKRPAESFGGALL